MFDDDYDPTMEETDIIAKLEARIRMLESELKVESRALGIVASRSRGWTDTDKIIVSAREAARKEVQA